VTGHSDHCDGTAGTIFNIIDKYVIFGKFVTGGTNVNFINYTYIKEVSRFPADRPMGD